MSLDTEMDHLVKICLFYFSSISEVTFCLVIFDMFIFVLRLIYFQDI